MKSSKFVCKLKRHLYANCKFDASIAHGSEAASCEPMPITVDTLGEIKEIKLKNLAYFS